MFSRYRLVDISRLFRALWRMLKHVLFLSVGLTVSSCFFFASIAFTRNRDGDICDYYKESFIYYAKDDCYVKIVALLKYLFVFFPLFNIFFLVISVATDEREYERWMT